MSVCTLWYLPTLIYLLMILPSKTYCLIPLVLPFCRGFEEDTRQQAMAEECLHRCVRFVPSVSEFCINLQQSIFVLPSGSL
jgi:hypothetical protein